MASTTSSAGYARMDLAQQVHARPILRPVLSTPKTCAPRIAQELEKKYCRHQGLRQVWDPDAFASPLAYPLDGSVLSESGHLLNPGDGDIQQAARDYQLAALPHGARIDTIPNVLTLGQKLQRFTTNLTTIYADGLAVFPMETHFAATITCGTLTFGIYNSMMLFLTKSDAEIFSALGCSLVMLVKLGLFGASPPPRTPR